MTEPVTIGVLGGCSWIANAAVLPAIGASAHAVVGSVGSRSGSTTYDDVLRDPANDAVYVALPNGLHREWVERAAAAGKHVLCEKPLASSTADVIAMAAACDAAGVVLAEAYMSPFHPRSAEIAGRLGSGDLGDIRRVDAAFTFRLAEGDNYRWLPDQGGGALLDVGIYCLAPIICALGIPSGVDAWAVLAPTGVDLTTSARLTWLSDTDASVLVSFELPERQSLFVAGTGGSLAVDRPYTPGPHDVAYAITRPDGAVEQHTTDGANCYVGMIDAFAASVRGRAEWPRPISDVLAVLGLCERINAATEATR